MDRTSNCGCSSSHQSNSNVPNVVNMWMIDLTVLCTPQIIDPTVKKKNPKSNGEDPRDTRLGWEEINHRTSNGGPQIINPMVTKMWIINLI